MQLMWPGPMAAQAIYVAAKLGLADLLKDGPKTADELGHLTGSHGPSLRRLLRALVGAGIFVEDAGGGVRNTDLSETLCTNNPESMRAWAMFLSGPFVWRALGALHEAIRTGQPAVNHVYGRSFWVYLTEHADDAAVFNAAMTAGSEMSIPPVLKAYDFSSFKTIVDVGGGHGTLLAAILRTCPGARGVLYDLPAVVAGADIVRDEGLGGRCEVHGGDCFQSVPEGGDAYILKGVIHDWSDDDALRILKNCRRAMKPNGRLLIMEMVLEPPSQAPPGDFMDLLMLALTGGRERTEADFRMLLEKASLSMREIVRTELPLSIIESQPV